MFMLLLVYGCFVFALLSFVCLCWFNVRVCCCSLLFVVLRVGVGLLVVVLVWCYLFVFVLFYVVWFDFGVVAVCLILL